MSAAVLVAGVGNRGFADDGFGCAVAARLAEEASLLPPGVKVVDFGIRGMHLAYELAGGAWDAAILVDAVSRHAPPGTLSVSEPTIADLTTHVVDAHSLDLLAVFAMTRSLGAMLPRLLLVGCEPAEIADRVGLSATVARAVDPAAAQVRSLARALVQTLKEEEEREATG